MQTGRAASADELVTTTTAEDGDGMNYLAMLLFLSIMLNALALVSALLGCACFLWGQRVGVGVG
eukprot:9590589-Alexandrium_andersonii.AAC.1